MMIGAGRMQHYRCGDWEVSGVQVLSFSFTPVTPDTVPPGRVVDLPGRGSTYVVDVPGGDGGPPLFLLHGLVASTYLNWFPAFTALSPHFRVLGMDLRGHGRGIPLGRRRFRLADCADDAVAVADALGIERIIPVGYSLGGPVAQMVWRRHPDRVAGLVRRTSARANSDMRRPVKPSGRTGGPGSPTHGR